MVRLGQREKRNRGNRVFLEIPQPNGKSRNCRDKKGCEKSLKGTQQERKKKERERNKQKKVESGKEGRNGRLIFWNVEEVERKDEDFWKYVASFDFVRLMETWADQGIGKDERNTPKRVYMELLRSQQRKAKGKSTGGGELL